MNEAYDKIKTAIHGFERGTTFFADSLAAFAEPAEISTVLAQLCMEEIILCITDDFYVYPKLYGKFGMKYERPWVYDVLEEYARHKGFRLAPTAAYAENALHLSTQVQTRYVYLTDGESRELKFYDSITVNLQQFTDFKLFAFRSRLMQMIAISLQHITQQWVTDGELATLRSYLTHVSEEDLQHDLALSPEWMREALINFKN